jgi:hypothetical protein
MIDLSRIRRIIVECTSHDSLYLVDEWRRSTELARVRKVKRRPSRAAQIQRCVRTRWQPAFQCEASCCTEHTISMPGAVLRVKRAWPSAAEQQKLTRITYMLLRAGFSIEHMCSSASLMTSALSERIQ